MKVMEKAFLEERDALEEVMNEVAILQTLRHPFITRLYCSFQTREQLCMLMEFQPGGELYTVSRHQLIPEEAARVHAAQVSLALDYLHAQGIIYRDLKPENVVLDARANCMLTDFGLAHRSGDERGGAPFGSVPYMAPELFILPVQVTKAVDWWALGCLIFEVTTGRHPFLDGNPDGDGEVSLARVLGGSPDLTPPPDAPVSAAMVDVVARFLEKDPTHRLQDLDTIKAQPWFHGLSWAAVYEREAPPTYCGMPWRPPVDENAKFDDDPSAPAPPRAPGSGPEDDDAACHVDGFDFTSEDFLRDVSVARLAQGRQTRP
jgi:serine/threonine protein kinase